jgi:UDP-N-acetylglucosamine--N-acetylmuramyl-(pentapeptide) pyrophosphoryl-undecaprenol N-acetylglucosamine transferase
VLPALAVADALVASGHEPASIHYVGCTRGIETRLLPDTAYPHTFLDVVGFQRRVDRRNLGFVPKMLRARRAAIDLLGELSPSVVVSVGGYASMPAVFAARKLGVPVVVVSYDRTPGRASRLSARRAAACAVAFDGSPLPNAEVTGAPVRRAVLDVDREQDRLAARERLGIDPGRFVVTVMGGSLGSGVLNEAISAYAVRHRDDAGLTVHHVAGERFASSVGVVEGAVDHRVVGYEPDMPAVYAASDLLVGRGGASTVHEVAVTGVPSILVPWSGAADDHQRDNVEWLADVGGAVLLAEDELDRLADEIDRLRADDRARAALAAAARRRGEIHRSGALARLIERVAVTSPPS